MPLNRPLRIAVTADPFIPVPPLNYGGIERIIHFLVEGLKDKGHEVLLVGHPDSQVSTNFLPYQQNKSGISGHISHIKTLNKIRDFHPDLIHSFSRLAYLITFMRSDIPKLMSYQREPTLSQIQKAVKVSKKDSLAFTGCSNYISDKIRPLAPSYTVYNGIDLNIYTFRESVDNDAPLVFLGRIEPIKGTHVAIEAALATNKKLIIAGNIPAEYEWYFKEKVKPFLNDKIQYTGPVNDMQKNELLGKALAFLMPIEWDEPFGIVMTEALACGTPVIGYRRGAVPEVVEHGKNGYIADDFSSLCSFIQNVERLQRNEARKSAEKRFSSEIIVDEYMQVYKSLIK